MKKIFKYFGVLFSVALMGFAVTSCFPEDIEGPESVGLGIKTVFPTKVVPGLEITVNGSGFNDVTEIVFPEEKSVTSFTKVTDNMLRVVVPKGVADGKLIVKTENDQAESSAELTVGNTVVKGFSSEEGTDINGGDQLTIYGEDLEFISSVEFFDPDGNSLKLIKDTEFYRKSTGNVIVTLPKKMAEKDVVITGKIKTVDGKVFNIYALNYKPSMDGGHWETKKTVIWTNETTDIVDWGNVNYRFALDGNDGNNECDATFPQEIWDKIKSETFYMTLTGESPQIRVADGWWQATLTADDIFPGNDLLADNGDGTWTLTVNLTGAPDLLAKLDAQHLLFTGGGYLPIDIYFSEQEWVEGEEGHMEIVKTTFWENTTTDVVDWGNVNYRFALDGNDGNNECDATFPQEIWDKIKSETFYMTLTGESPQIRVADGWWQATLTADDIFPGSELLADNGDGTWTLTVNLTGAEDLLSKLDAQHLLFTGGGYVPIDMYFAEEVWIGGGGGSTPKEVVIWENETTDVVDWGNVNYRFALDGNDGNNECDATFPQEVWDKIKSETFYMTLTGESPQIRVADGWWQATLTADDIFPGNELLADNGDGTWTLTVNLTGAEDLLGKLDAQHLLFTGGGYTPLKLFFLE